MRYFLLAILLVGCTTTATEPTMQDAINIQKERDIAKEQQRQLHDYVHAKNIQDTIDRLQANK